MKIVWELGFDEAADGVDFELGDRSRFAVEHDERDTAVRAERGGRVASEVVKVDENVVLKEGLFHNLIAIAPAAADLESGKKGVEAVVGTVPGGPASRDGDGYIERTRSWRDCKPVTREKLSRAFLELPFD